MNAKLIAIVVASFLLGAGAVSVFVVVQQPDEVVAAPTEPDKSEKAKRAILSELQESQKAQRENYKWSSE